jgi:hypothetical protein
MIQQSFIKGHTSVQITTPVKISQRPRLVESQMGKVAADVWFGHRVLCSSLGSRRLPAFQKEGCEPIPLHTIIQPVVSSYRQTRNGCSNYPS